MTHLLPCSHIDSHYFELEFKDMTVKNKCHAHAWSLLEE